MASTLPISRPLCMILHTTTALLPRSTTGAAPRALLSTSARLLYRQNPVPNSNIPIPSPTAQAPHIPEYPFGPRRVYKQSNTGLYGSQRIRFGNNVSENHKVKTRRKWRVNVQRKRLWSDALATFVRTRVTTRVLRTIDKMGGLDNYLLGTKPARVKDLGPWGWRLRWRLMQTPAVQARLNAQRESLGLPPKVYEVEEYVPPADAAEEMVFSEGNFGAFPPELQAEGISSTEALLETNQMLQNEEEFALGGEAEEDMREEFELAEDIEEEIRAEEEIREQRGFMHEEKPQQKEQ